jgi:Zn-finger in ubiquitin-hydrolases and other protein
MATCSHLGSIRTDRPHCTGCEECLKVGDTWVHLRLCRICGHVGCCDDSKNRHASKHYHLTKHAIITSLEPGENWSWCYIDQVLIEGA